MSDKLYIRNTLNAPRADVERCAGAVEISAEMSDDERLKWFLFGCGAGPRELLKMESGDTPEDYRNRCLIDFQRMDRK